MAAPSSFTNRVARVELRAPEKAAVELGPNTSALIRPALLIVALIAGAGVLSIVTSGDTDDVAAVEAAAPAPEPARGLPDFSASVAPAPEPEPDPLPVADTAPPGPVEEAEKTGPRLIVMDNG